MTMNKYYVALNIYATLILNIYATLILSQLSNAAIMLNQVADKSRF